MVGDPDVAYKRSTLAKAGPPQFEPRRCKRCRLMLGVVLLRWAWVSDEAAIRILWGGAARASVLYGTIDLDGVRHNPDRP